MRSGPVRFAPTTCKMPAATTGDLSLSLGSREIHNDERERERESYATKQDGRSFRFDRFVPFRIAPLLRTRSHNHRGTPCYETTGAQQRRSLAHTHARTHALSRGLRGSTGNRDDALAAAAAAANRWIPSREHKYRGGCSRRETRFVRVIVGTRKTRTVTERKPWEARGGSDRSRWFGVRFCARRSSGVCNTSSSGSSSSSTLVVVLLYGFRVFFKTCFSSCGSL